MKQKCKRNSDVDLYVCSKLQGLSFVRLIERLRQVPHKKVDLIRESELENNTDFVDNILMFLSKEKNFTKVYIIKKTTQTFNIRVVLC